MGETKSYIFIDAYKKVIITERLENHCQPFSKSNVQRIDTITTENYLLKVNVRKVSLSSIFANLGSLALNLSKSMPRRIQSIMISLSLLLILFLYTKITMTTNFQPLLAGIKYMLFTLMMSIRTCWPKDQQRSFLAFQYFSSNFSC